MPRCPRHPLPFRLLSGEKIIEVRFNVLNSVNSELKDALVACNGCNKICIYIYCDIKRVYGYGESL